MKKILLTLIIAISFSSAQAQKDTIPKQKNYVFTVPAPVFAQIDSILQRSYQFVGRRMDLEDGEILKQQLGSVIMYFLREKERQDTIGIKPKK